MKTQGGLPTGQGGMEMKGLNYEPRFSHTKRKRQFRQRRTTTVSCWRRRVLPDHLIRPRQYVRRNGEADLLRGFEIYDELKLRRLLYWKIPRLCAFEDLIDISGSAVM